MMWFEFDEEKVLFYCFSLSFHVIMRGASDELCSIKDLLLFLKM